MSHPKTFYSPTKQGYVWHYAERAAAPPASFKSVRLADKAWQKVLFVDLL